MSTLKLHKFKITPYSENDLPYIVSINTCNPELTMEAYQRNRKPLQWELL
jgi:hypothetical protein